MVKVTWTRTESPTIFTAEWTSMEEARGHAQLLTESGAVIISISEQIFLI